MDFRIPRRDWNHVATPDEVLILRILEYLGGIETVRKVWLWCFIFLDFRIPRRDWNFIHLDLLDWIFEILEYLGGIETRIDIPGCNIPGLILEYLGGIETPIADFY